MNHKPDIDLHALRAGDRRAFAALVERHSAMIYQLALRILKDPQEAEDALQDTFLNAYRAIGRFEGRASPGTWLYRIAYHQALMRLRKASPEWISMDAPVDDQSGWKPAGPFEDWCCLPEKDFMTSEAQAVLEEAINQLSPALSAAFVLRDLQGFSTSDTAGILQISEAAVKTRLLRARLQLRESLSSYFGERVRERDRG
jgi:RNA polymerase sigma-70 factor, ECF subfamily